jgi:hypothetical protein
VVAGKQDVTIAVFVGDDDRIGYEIFSGSGEQQIIHCQGRIVAGDEPVPAPLDLDELRPQMRRATLDAASVYAELAKLGIQFGPAEQAMKAIHHGDGQLLAHLSRPALEPADEANASDGAYVLHPSLMSGALQAAGWLLASLGQRPSAAASPRSVERWRILSPCTDEMFVWARTTGDARMEEEPIELDLDLVDTRGNVCVQMRRLSFPIDDAAAPPAEHRMWVFSKERPVAVAAGGVYAGAMGARDKMALFLRQETAVQLQKALEEVPTDRSYFDLGLTSLGMAHLVQNTCRLLDENLSPSVLFEHSDIQSLAGYLATTYPARIDAVTAVRNGNGHGHSGERLQVRPEPLTPLPRRRAASGGFSTPRRGHTGAAASRGGMNIEQILDRVSWQQASLDDGYEKVTF